MKLENQVAIVTGSGKGIGLATCKALLAKGVRVAGLSRSGTHLTHLNFKSYQVNVADQQSVLSAMLQVNNDFGDVGILINNAGLGYEGPLDVLPASQWHEMMDVNVNGMFYCTQACLPAMKKNKIGHIVNISSIAGTTGIPNMTAYCTTKYAVRGFSNALFKEVRSFGVKVSCIYPGSVKTNFFDKIDSVNTSDDMMMPEDIASTIIHCLEAPDNYLTVDIEVRPLRLRG
jgi:NADP-dependent 3-hydroxy acid dehydrogenase YdfG